MESNFKYLKYLKPCPFCGGRATYENEVEKGPIWLRCAQCRVGIDPQWYDGDLGVVEASWNTRFIEKHKHGRDRSQEEKENIMVVHNVAIRERKGHFGALPSG